MNRPSILICTVGTSLFKPNLAGLPKPEGYSAWADNARKQGENEPPSLEAVNALCEAYADKDIKAIADALLQLSPNSRICGAEMNSIASMIDKGYVPGDCGLFFLHSDTDDGRNIAAILKRYYLGNKHAPVETVEIPDLQDQDPKRFRTKGLRNLARKLCAVIRERSVSACAINATGGYKAQIAIAVLLGQAIGVPVYYKHEQFSEIIAFPPMPVALDFEVWMKASGVLFELARDMNDFLPADQFADEWQDPDLAERLEALVEREDLYGVPHLALSPTGQIFHDTFRERFRTNRDQVLPPPVPLGQKKEPILKSDEGHMLAHQDEIKRFLIKVTQQVPQVALCVTNYFNPDLPERARFRSKRESIEGIYSNGSFTVKFRVETSATTPGQQAAVVAALNEWLNR
jgi:putative CRISPR-associated protein (TIGR02619 family)